MSECSLFKYKFSNYFFKDLSMLEFDGKKEREKETKKINEGRKGGREGRGVGEEK